MSDPHHQPHQYASYPYGVPIPASSSTHAATHETNTGSVSDELARAEAAREARAAKGASWGSYNQFVGVGLGEPGEPAPGGPGPSTAHAGLANPYDAALTPQRSYDHTPAGSPSPSPSPGPAPGNAYHYRPARQASVEADIADGFRGPGPGPSMSGAAFAPAYAYGRPRADSGHSEHSNGERLSWHAKGGNKLRRVKERITYDEDGRPRREKKDKYGVKEIPEGWTAEDEEAEREFLASSMFNWQELMTWRFWIRKEWWCKCARGGAG